MFQETSDAELRLDRPERAITHEDWERYRSAVEDVLAAFGMNLDTPGTREAPSRLLTSLYSMTAGYDGDPKLVKVFPAEHDPGVQAWPGQVLRGPIEVTGLCELDAMPLINSVFVAYVPGDSILGLSKLTRLSRVFGRRFTSGQRLATEIADGLDSLVGPLGVAVNVRSRHASGVESPACAGPAAFSVWRGCYLSHELQREFLDQIASHGRSVQPGALG